MSTAALALAMAHEETTTPIGILLTPAQAVRLEVLIAQQREINPALDDDVICDQIFARGLEAFEQTPSQAVADANAELLFDQILDQGEYITQLLDRIAAMKTELAAALAEVRAAREAA